MLGLLVGLVACSDPEPVDDTADAPEPAVSPDFYRTVRPDMEFVRIKAGDEDPVGFAYAVPEDPVGMVWAFHGGKGELRSVGQAEWVDIYNQLWARDIGIVFTASLDRQSGLWSEPDDLPRIRMIWNRMVDEGLVALDTPMGAIAFSGGVRMAATLEREAQAEGWQVSALLLHQGAEGDMTVPAFYVAAENDETGRSADFYENTLAVCRDRVGDCRLREGREIPLDPRRFMRLEGVDREKSLEIFDEMVSIGMVSGAGERQVDFGGRERVDDIVYTYEERSRFGNALRFATQLRVVWATHRLSSAFAEEEADFVLEHMRP